MKRVFLHLQILQLQTIAVFLMQMLKSYAAIYHSYIHIFVFLSQRW